MIRGLFGTGTVYHSLRQGGEGAGLDPEQLTDALPSGVASPHPETPCGWWLLSVDHPCAPSSRRPPARHLMRKTLSDYEPLSVTRLLPTKLDEVPDEWAIFDLAADDHYPMRWSTNGQAVPVDLRSPAPRLLVALAAAPRSRPVGAEG